MTLSLFSFLFFTALLGVHAQSPPPPPPSPPPPPPRPPPPPSPPPPIACITFLQCPYLQRCIGGVCVPRPVCFPGDATVETTTGVKLMKELTVGDKVMVGKTSKDGIEYSDIYGFGHKDPDGWSDFVQVKVAGPSSVNLLELSSAHFVPVFSEGRTINKRAKDVRVGDKVWASFHNMSGIFTVEELASVYKEGLFNPLTLRGTIVVNGVQASVHSDWFLDKIFDAFGITEWLPATYQALLLPPRILFHVFGSRAYSSLYRLADSYLKFAELGTKFGAEIVLAFAIATMATTKLVISKLKNF